MGEVGLRTVRNGKAVWQFNAEAVASATSERAGVPRWSELVVYRLAGNQYLIAKGGYSTVAHKPTCQKARPRTMRSIGQLQGSGSVPVQRTPCTLCWPDVGAEMELQTLMETNRHSVLQARNAHQMLEVLTERRAEGDLPELVLEVIRQATKNDEDVAQAWAAITHERSPS